MIDVTEILIHCRSGLSGVGGPRGEQGIPGIKGPDGLQGHQGNTGEKGRTGLSGEKGFRGEIGEAGASVADFNIPFNSAILIPNGDWEVDTASGVTECSIMRTSDGLVTMQGAITRPTSTSTTSEDDQIIFDLRSPHLYSFLPTKKLFFYTVGSDARGNLSKYAKGVIKSEWHYPDSHGNDEGWVLTFDSKYMPSVPRISLDTVCYLGIPL